MSSQPNLQRVFRSRLVTDRQPTPVHKPHSKYKDEMMVNEQVKAEAYSLINADKYAVPPQNKYINQSHIKYDFQPVEPQKLDRKLGDKGRYEQRKILKNMLNEIDNAKKEYEEVKRSQDVVEGYFKNVSSRVDESSGGDRRHMRQSSVEVQKAKAVDNSDKKNAPYYLATEPRHRRARSMTPGNKRISKTIERSNIDSQVSFVDEDRYFFYFISFEQS